MAKTRFALLTFRRRRSVGVKNEVELIADTDIFSEGSVVRKIRRLDLTQTVGDGGTCCEGTDNIDLTQMMIGKPSDT